MSKSNIPHKTVIWIKAITYEILPTGECSGMPVQKREEILAIDANNIDLCLQRTEQVLEEIKCLKQKLDSSQKMMKKNQPE